MFENFLFCSYIIEKLFTLKFVKLFSIFSLSYLHTGENLFGTMIFYSTENVDEPRLETWAQ